MAQLVFVTGNDNKAREAAEILGVEIERVKLDLDELQSMDLATIVEHKTKQAYAKLGKPVIVEDVSFMIEQWNGFPGPFIKWVKETISFEKLPSLVQGSNRTAVWRAMYGYYDGKVFKTFVGEEKGSVAKKPQGNRGFGFDKIFIPHGERQTVAQLGDEIKNKQSARYLALRKLARFLRTQK
jgi:non-canonical purine NTP pyrophosphatase (RdgB/HAM1 family)